ncbi:MAG: metal ABC transporter permease, partial [Ruminococcus sp.]|nr:metal ABC transporter permease [Ruminococcus sp.]
RMSERGHLKGDSAIAIFSTSALAVGILVSSKAGLMQDVSSYMFGSILAMSKEDVALSVGLSVLVIGAYLILYHRIYAVTFDEEFSRATGINVRFYNTLLAVLTAITVVLGMMMMGSLLISSLIIFPSVSAMRVCRSFRGVVVCSALISVFCFLLGFFVSLTMNTAPGASVVVANLLIFAIFSLIGVLRGRSAS